MSVRAHVHARVRMHVHCMCGRVPACGLQPGPIWEFLSRKMPSEDSGGKVLTRTQTSVETRGLWDPHPRENRGQGAPTLPPVRLSEASPRENDELRT